MFFQIYGETAGWQLLGWLLVFAGLVIMNEIARRSKWGGIACFLVLPAVLSVYFIAIYIGVGIRCEMGADMIYVHMNSLVPLCETVCGNRRLYRIYDPEVPLGKTWKSTLVQSISVCYCSDQYLDRSGI